MTPYYEDAHVRLYLGDCREVLPTLEPVDLVLTDIPYNISQESGGLRVLDYGGWDHGFDTDSVVPMVAPRARKACAIWCSHFQISGIMLQYQAIGWSVRMWTWTKPNPSVMNGDRLWLNAVDLCAWAKPPGAPFYEHCRPAHWHGQPPRNRQHPTQKPAPLMNLIIEGSTIDGDVVLDPFAGSGTTLRAAKDLGRKAIGIEIEERYCEIAAKRMAQEVLF